MDRAERSYWSWANWTLIFLILVINLYIVSAPLLPKVGLEVRQKQAKKTAGLPYKTKLDKTSPATSIRASVPADNRLVIPKLALNEHIYQGSDSHIVNLGVWARPKTSIPPGGSNTVLVGHRFTYGGPATFYSLDKVDTGDSIVIYWQGKEYDYRVSQTKVVPPTATEVEDPTNQAQLTIYTCTPLWSAKNRLVVVAKPVNGAAL